MKPRKLSFTIAFKAVFPASCLNYVAEEIVRGETRWVNRVTAGNWLFLQLVSSATVTCAERSVVLLSDAKGRCGTSCRDDVTLRNNWKNGCSVARRDAYSWTYSYFSQLRLGATKVLRRMSVTGYVGLGNFCCNLRRNKIVRQVAAKIAFCDVSFKVRNGHFEVFKGWKWVKNSFSSQLS